MLNPETSWRYDVFGADLKRRLEAAPTTQHKNRRWEMVGKSGHSSLEKAKRVK